MTLPNLLTEWAWLLIDSFARAGIRDVITSPGGRSTPFVYAAVRHQQLCVHDVIDERNAAFFALGQARVTGRPSLLICTSGSAGAHYFPAIVEAGASFIPLVVLTADRPNELLECAAPQTVDQKKFYGSHVRKFFDLGTPDAAPPALHALRRVAAQAVFSAQYPTPGAVHINAPARKPLEPCESLAATDTDAVNLHELVRQIARVPVVRAVAPRVQVDRTALEDLANACSRFQRGLIVCGPLAPSLPAGAIYSSIKRLAAASEFPVLAESTSQLRLSAGGGIPKACPAFDAVLRSETFVRQHAPELILQIGVPTSSAWDDYVQRYRGCERYVLTEHGWTDPQSTATAMLFGNIADAVNELAVRVDEKHQSPPAQSSTWLDDFSRADALAWEAIHRELEAEAISEGLAVRAVVEHVPCGSILVVGNSLSVRQVDTYSRTGRGDVTVLSQRGASGIDGLLSGAAGTAQSSALPTTILMGDVSLLHDLTGLQLAARLTTPLVVVVINNDGGRIFEQLPLAECNEIDAATLAHWTTPHGLSFEHAARLFGVGYYRVASRTELVQALQMAHDVDGCSVIEVKVPAHGAVEENRRVWRAVDEALASEVWRSA